jgi:hypothetical protein
MSIPTDLENQKTNIRISWYPDEVYFWATHSGAEMDLVP